MIRSALFTAFALAATAATAPAFAADLPTAQVRFNDLSLTTAQGAAELKARVARAARNVCAAEGSHDLKAQVQAVNCTEVAIAKAMPQVELALANAKNTRVAENSRVSVSAH